MGINLGAVHLAACMWLVGREHTGSIPLRLYLGGNRMVIALGTYLLGLRWIVEVDQGNVTKRQNQPRNPRIEQTPSVVPLLVAIAPWGLIGLGSCSR